MDDIEILLALLAVAAGAVWVARALEIPYPFLLVLAGVGVGYLPGVSEIEVAPDVIFLVFLPPLLHAAGWISSPRHLRTYATGVTLLAGVLVLLTTGAVAVVAHAVIPGLSWGAAFVLGAIVSATDTVAATAVFRRLGVPERVVALVEGESLVNDGTALVLYRTAVPAAVAGAFSLGDAVHDFLLVGTGGAAFGLALGWLVRRLRRRIDDDLIEITVTLLTAYIAFIGAEELGPLRRAGRRRQRPLPRRAPVAGLLRRHAAEGVLVLGGARLPPRIGAVHPHRPAVPGRARRARASAPRAS